MTRYLSIRCRARPELEDLIVGLVGSFPVLGAETVALDDGRLQATVYLEMSERRAARELGRSLAELGAEVERPVGFEGRDWLAEYRCTARPFGVGDTWWIEPRPDQPTAAPAGRTRLVIEPTTAFGSGTHASTRLVLEALEELPIDGRPVLDLGTGSGILCFAAAARGARPVIGLDVDREAIWAARRAAAHQQPAMRVGWLVATVDAIGAVPFDVVLCNMVLNNLLAQVPGVAERLAPDGHAVLAGFLVAEHSVVAENLGCHGLRIQRSLEMEGWSAVVAAHG